MNQNIEFKTRLRSPRKHWKVIKGNLYARLRYQDESGKWKEKLKPITDKRTAQRVVEDMRRELEQHSEEILHSDKLTFNELADRYQKVEMIEAVYQNGSKITGKRSIAPVLSAIKPLREFFGKKQIRSIKTSDIRDYKNKRINTDVAIEVNKKSKILNEKTNRNKISIEKVIKTHPRKIATVNRELARLRAMLNFAIENDWLITNPFSKLTGIISASAEVERDRVLSFEEEENLLSVCTKERAHIKPILICALDTAMRRGEMFKMRWKEVDFTKSEIYIPKANTKPDEARTVGITERLNAELKELWQRSSKQLNDLVFGVKDIKKAWGTACELAGINNFRFHDCRHTATTRMIASGSPHAEVMKITGHSQLKTFLRYLNITPETSRKVATNLDAYLSKNESSDRKSDD